MTRCCKDCPKRDIGCHATCQTYIVAKAQHDAERKRNKLEWDVDNYQYSMQFKRRKIYAAIRKERGNE